MTRNATFRFAALVLAACALHVVLVALAGPGFNGSDDEVYARLAHDLASGRFELLAEHRANRLGLIAPTAAAYGIAGVGRWTTVAWPLTVSLLGIGVVALVARRLGGERAGVLAGFAYAVLTTVVGSSAFLMPDGPLGVQMLAATACLWVGRDAAGKRAASWGGGAALLVAAGVLTKLTVLWIAPFFGALFVADLVRRRHAAFWASFALTGAVCAAVFFGAYAIATGDALFRLHAVDAQHNDTHWAYENASTAQILRRVTYEPGLMWGRALPGMLVIAAVATVAVTAVSGSRHRGTRERADRLFWAGYAAVVVSGFWVGTTSFSRFAPLPLLPRMLAPAAPPLAVLAGAALAGRTDRLRDAVPALALLGAGAALAVADGRVLIAAVYAGGAATVLAATRGSGAAARIAGPLVVAIPLAMTAYSIVRRGAAESPAMRDERSLVLSLSAETGPGAVVLTDRRSERIFRFYRAYAAALPEVVDWDGLEAAPHAPGATFVYWHPGRVAWRGGRAAPPDWLRGAVGRGATVWESDDARLVRLNP